MEIPVTRSFPATVGKADHVGLGFYSNLISRVFSRRRSKSCSGQSIKCSPRSLIRLVPRASASSEALISNSSSTSRSRRTPINRPRLHVGLPLDAVSDTNNINHARAIAAGLRALKLLGVHGVELPIWWGIVEKEAMGKYDWSGYLSLAEMVKEMGLKLHISVCFHASREPKIPLPQWVSQAGESQPSIFFTDRSGKQYKECLSLAVDDLPVLNGKTPVQVYGDFLDNLKSAFSSFLGSTITGVSIGLGPDGELRYPSHHPQSRGNPTPGVGEFQCYDANMLSQLKHHAESSGHPLWGLSGPHDAPSYNQTPQMNNFVNEQRGSWETPYGNFFLSWYSSQLISHGDRLLSRAASTFSDTKLKVYGNLPVAHTWYKTRSHPAELTAGFYNTVNRNGYEAVAAMFAKNRCTMVLPGMDLSDENQPLETHSSPESLLGQITAACRSHGVEVAGQNLSVSGTSSGFEQIKKNLLDENKGVDLFTYQRMGAQFFSPKHFSSFTAFVWSLKEAEMCLDDESSDSVSGSERGTQNLHMQSA